MDWRRTRHELPSAFEGALVVDVCRPFGLGDHEEAPLLWVHDGPAYDAEGALVEWVAERVDSGRLPPVRLVLAQVRRRIQWYTASPRYLRSFTTGVSSLERMYAVRSPVVVMGASLGGLTSVLAGLRDERVGAVFAQSGSFFTRATDAAMFAAETDGREADRERFERVARAVEGFSRPAAARDRPLRVALTCGREEDNVANNRLAAAALRKAGIACGLTEVDGGHDYAAWHAAFDPTLCSLLQDVWE